MCGSPVITDVERQKLGLTGQHMTSLDGFGTAEVVRNYIKSLKLSFFNLVEVNDSRLGKYTEDTPKARVMHLVNDMIAAGF